MREIIDSPEFENSKSKLSVALGRDISGNVTIANLAKMPHMLIAGATGSENRFVLTHYREPVV